MRDMETTTPDSIGRDYSPTDLDSHLIGLLGYEVAYVEAGERRTGILSNVCADGTVTLTDRSDIVVAIVPASEVRTFTDEQVAAAAMAVVDEVDASGCADLETAADRFDTNETIQDAVTAARPEGHTHIDWNAVVHAAEAVYTARNFAAEEENEYERHCVVGCTPYVVESLSELHDAERMLCEHFARHHEPHAPRGSRA
jgi:hypothetical protein